MMMIKADGCDKSLQELKQRLKSKPDGFMIGFGLRAILANTTFFEDCENASWEIGLRMKMGSNKSPTNVVECLHRNSS